MNAYSKAEFLGRFMAISEMLVKAVDKENDASLLQILKTQADTALNDYRASVSASLQIQELSDRLSDSAIDRGNNS